MKRYHFVCILVIMLFCLLFMMTSCKDDVEETTHNSSSDISTSAPSDDNPVIDQSFLLENDALSAKVTFQNGSISLTSLYNKAAKREYLADGGRLFSYTYGEYDNGNANGLRSVSSDGGNWSFVSAKETEIMMNISTSQQKKVGKTTEVIIKDEAAGLQITLLFEIYDGVAGVRYQALIKNLSDQKIVITKSDVISLSLPNEKHYLHYISAETMIGNSNIATNSSWKSTQGKLNPNIGRNALCVYESGDGWWIMPETNWRTQLGPDEYGAKPGNTYATYEFATTSCWANDDQVKVITNPKSLMLTLKPDEEFEYIGVNFTVFKGDVVDGKMAAEEHFYKRFLYHDTSTIINTNDWYYLNKRTAEYFENVVIPKAKAAGIDMIMLDDLWNTSRDTITAISALGSLESFSKAVKDEGFLLGLWYSMSGGDHNGGRDLADPKSLEEKIALVETLISEYGMNHMMVDLTEYWQNTEETDYSSPCDNVYRKNVMVQNALNLLVEKYPEFYVKPTNEVDVYPTQGNRSNGLLHVMNNGWVVGNGGLGNGMYGLVNMFGYLPLSATYGDGNVDGNIAEYYYYLFCRNVKLPHAPDSDAWTENGISLMAMFNAWRNAERVEALLSDVKRPSYLGEGWDGNDQEEWIKNGAQTGPYAWTYVNNDKTRALLIATTDGNEKKNFTADLRWLDASKTYLVCDVSLDEKGFFNYQFMGTYKGSDLVSTGFAVKLKDENVGGKAFWFEAVEQDGVSVAYANEAVATYSISANGDTYTLSVTGKVGTVAVVIVGDRTTNRGLVLRLIIGENGKRSVSFTASDLLEAKKTKPQFADSTIIGNSGRLELETLYTDGKLGYSDSSIKVNVRADDASTVGASNNDYRKIDFPKGAGSYITIPVTVTKAGQYLITVGMKSNENQAKAAIGLNGKRISDIVDLSNGYPLNRIYTISAIMDLNAGTNYVYIFAVEKGASNNASALSLRIDYLDYEPLADNSGMIEAETIPSLGTVVDISTASGQKAVKFSSDAIGSYTDIPLSLPKGRYDITLTFVSNHTSPMVAIILNGEGTGEIVDLYSADSASRSVTLTLDLTGHDDYVRILTIGKKNASGGYSPLLDTIVCKGKEAFSSNTFGITVNIGETIELDQHFNTDDTLSYMVYGETSLGVATVKDGKLIANREGFVLVRAYNADKKEFALLAVSVISNDTSDAVCEALEAINRGTYADAKRLYDKLSTDQKDGAVAFWFLENKEAVTSDDAVSKEVYYLDEMEYGYNEGSTVKNGTCPSGSHKLQFVENGAVYEHGIGFEPTVNEAGVLYVKIPENATRFKTIIGLDSEMSKTNYSYDQKNNVLIYVDGIKVVETGAIQKNMQNGSWVDRTDTVDVLLPENSEYLVIVNLSGNDRTCDHILYADAYFSAE